MNNKCSHVTDSSYYNPLRLWVDSTSGTQRTRRLSFVASTIIFSLSPMFGVAHNRDISKRFKQSSKWVGFSMSATYASISVNCSGGAFLCSVSLVAACAAWVAAPLPTRNVSISCVNRCTCSRSTAAWMLCSSAEFILYPRRHLKRLFFVLISEY